MPPCTSWEKLSLSLQTMAGGAAQWPFSVPPSFPCNSLDHCPLLLGISSGGAMLVCVHLFNFWMTFVITLCTLHLCTLGMLVFGQGKSPHRPNTLWPTSVTFEGRPKDDKGRSCTTPRKVHLGRSHSVQRPWLQQETLFLGGKIAVVCQCSQTWMRRFLGFDRMWSPASTWVPLSASTDRLVKSLSLYIYY